MNAPQPPRRAAVSWCLYDFANSVYVAVIPATIWQAYYVQSVVGDAVAGTQWWGWSVSLTMAIVAVTSPFMGAVADLAGWRKRLLVIYTLVSVIATGLLASVGPGMILYGFLITVIAGVGFEGAMVFYNSFLPELAPPDKQGRLSGYGYAVGYAGSFLIFVPVLLLVRGGLFGATFLLVAVLFCGFALPAFIWLPRDRPARQGIWSAGVAGWRGTRATVRLVLRTPALRRFLGAYFLYIDGVNTVIAFSAIFTTTVLGFQMEELIPLYMTVQLSALLGAWLWAKPTDRKGPKFVVLVTLVQWVAVVVLVYFVQTKSMYFVVAAFAGTGLGAVQAASRAFMASLIPQGREGELFGFYSLCGKSAAVLGPLLFGMVTAATGGNLRLAALSILVFLVGGGVLLATLKAGVPSTQPSVMR
jgi:UMF1 family MFS transporter